MSSNHNDEHESKRSIRFDGKGDFDVDPNGDMEDYGEETSRKMAVDCMFEPVRLVVPSSSSVQSKVPIPSVDETFKWVIREVPTLAEFYPLESTAAIVMDVQVPVVAERISRVLRDRSIQASYDNDKAKVKCVTENGVDFRVRLYRGRDKFQNGIIVEVQRRFGASFDFHDHADAILRAAKGERELAPVPPPPSFAPMAADVDDEEDYLPTPSGGSSSSLALVAKMLAHKGYDSQYLALQILLPLTDKSKMGTKVARSVSNDLLKVDSLVGRMIMEFFLRKPVDGEEDVFKLHTMAMMALANALQAVDGTIEIALREEIRPILLQSLRMADKSPHTAFQAARCVETLLFDDHNKSDFYEPLMTAAKAGAARHVALEKQAKKCLGLL